MKTIRTLLILSIFIAGFAQQTYAKKLQTYVSYSTFSSPSDGPYLETYLAFSGRSIYFVKNEKNKFLSNIEITMIFSQNNVVKAFDKYIVNIPEQEDTLNIKNFIDQHRFALPNGSYLFEIQINDKNSINKSISGKDSITINFPTDKIMVSGIQPIETYTPTVKPSTYTKSGYDLAPMVINFYPKTINKLAYYTEIYNTDKLLGKDEKFITKCYVESYESKIELPEYEIIKRETTKPVQVILQEIAIDKLPSGNYNLVVEVRDKDNQMVSINKMFFQRSNPGLTIKPEDLENLILSNSFAEKIKNRDTLIEYIRYLYPISSEIEKSFAQNLVKQNDVSTNMLQKYFLKFWMDRNNTNPELAWNNYLFEVTKVNNSYSTGYQKGYLSDRGRVYLQYGPPNSIKGENFDQASFPYEIWHYYRIGNQSNKKFVFCSHDEAANNYELINSDVNGEVSDLGWMNKIKKGDYKDVLNYEKQPQEDGIYGGKLIENFKNY